MSSRFMSDKIKHKNVRQFASCFFDYEKRTCYFLYRGIWFNSFKLAFFQFEAPLSRGHQLTFDCLRVQSLDNFTRKLFYIFQTFSIMEWSDKHDVIFLREMVASDIFMYKKGSVDRCKV